LALKSATPSQAVKCPPLTTWARESAPVECSGLVPYVQRRCPDLNEGPRFQTNWPGVCCIDRLYSAPSEHESRTLSLIEFDFVSAYTLSAPAWSINSTQPYPLRRLYRRALMIDWIYGEDLLYVGICSNAVSIEQVSSTTAKSLMEIHSFLAELEGLAFTIHATLRLPIMFRSTVGFLSSKICATDEGNAPCLLLTRGLRHLNCSS